MVKRIERVRRFVETECAAPLKEGDRPGVDAATVARALGINRTDASADLNELCRAGVLCRYGTRPVRFLTPELYEAMQSERTESTEERRAGMADAARSSAFDKIIGSDGSLKAQIDLAKAAVAYPPNGLHSLILGETGVGKSLLAEAMWHYRIELTTARDGPDSPRPPFVVFSCAEYADNPQLLLSQLFGYVKGAFTGAQEDREGLVDRAQGGILFLDEIHRLPQVGQELLFMLIDKGKYRRLGETRTEREANLMIIGATSEDPNSALLTTFRRRIPVQISLPSLSERPINERLDLIVHFVANEASRLNLPIWVSGQALRIFALYETTANIGELRSDIQLCCAKAYLSHVAAPRDRLILDIGVIPQRIYCRVKDNPSAATALDSLPPEGVLIHPGQMPRFCSMFTDYEAPINLYGFVDRKIEEYKFSSLSQQEIESRVGADLERYVQSAVRAFRKVAPPAIPTTIIAPAVWTAAEGLIAHAAEKLGRWYGREIQVAVALHLQQFAERLKSGRIIYNPHLKQIKARHGEEFAVVNECRVLLEHALSLEIPEDEMGFLAMFLVGHQEHAHQRVGLIVAAHGKSTATSMAEFVNDILGTHHVRAINAPLEKDLSETVEELRQAVSAANEGKGVLILADMGFFVQIEAYLSRESHATVRIIPNVTTALVLEAAKRILTTDDSLDKLVADLNRDFRDYAEALSMVREDPPPITGTILTVCCTGVGAAKRMRDLIIKQVPMARHMQIIPVSALDDIETIRQKAGDDLRLVIGSMNPGIPGVPFIPISQVFQSDGWQRLEFLLRGWDDVKPASTVSSSRQRHLDCLGREVHRFCPSLSPEIASRACEEMLSRIEGQIYRSEVSPDLAVRVYLHAASMLDRLATGNPLMMPSWGEKLREQRRSEYSMLEDILTDVCEGVGLKVPAGEVCYFLVTLPRISDQTE